MKSIAVFGAGAVGCFVGGKLRAAGHRVVFIGRRRAVDDLKAHGLVLSELDGAETVVPGSEIEASTEAAALSECDLVLVCVKSQDTETAAGVIAAEAATHATVVSLQNGVGNARMLGRHLGARPVAAGIVEFNVVVVDGGQFHRATEGGIVVKDTAETRALCDALNAAGTEASVHSDMQAVLWSKLLLNLNNALNVLADVPLVEQLSDRSYRLVLAQMVDEALLALRAARIHPARVGRMRPRVMPVVLRLPTWAFTRLASAMLAMDSRARSSMWMDLQIGRGSEVDYLNGAVVSLAREVGTEAKTNEAVTALVKAAFEEGRSPRLSGRALLERIPDIDAG